MTKPNYLFFVIFLIFSIKKRQFLLFISFFLVHRKKLVKLGVQNVSIFNLFGVFIMKKMFLCAILFLGYTEVSLSQDVDPIAVGVFVAGKGSSNVSKAKANVENGFVVTPVSDFGITGYIPVSKRKNMGVLLDVGLSSYSYKETPTTNPTDETTITSKFNYFSIAPSFTASYITFGFNLGLPMSTSRKNGSGTEVSTIDSFPIVKNGVNEKIPSDVKDNLQPTLEIRVGAMIPIVKTTLGRLNVFAKAGYMMSSMLKTEYYKIAGFSDTNPSMFSVSIGVNFLFTLQQPNTDEY